ncbi:aromatic acid exporter family protein [Streptomyces sp. NPDC001480]|uniref:FUSC family protein n=1 Tax=Streptomyces sp. NPDC001480 TaxID=3364577 RepID=UPI0036C967E2
MTSVTRIPRQALSRGASGVGRSVRAAWRGPGRERDLVVQSLKAAGAALLAWFVASNWLGDPLAMMAPWVALLMVQATVYSSLRQAAQQLAAICIGTLLGTAAHLVSGDTLGALAMCLPVLMLLANWSRFGNQGIYGATTAVFTLASGSVTAASAGHRVGESALGAVIGVAVNAFVLPPIHLRDVRENLAALTRDVGDVLCTIAGGLRRGDWDADTAADWSHDAARVELRLESLRSARGWSRESLRLTNRALRFLRRVPSDLPPEEEDERWSRVTGHVRALTRTLAVSADEGRTATPPDRAVLQPYAELLELIARSCHEESDRLLGGRPGVDSDARRGGVRGDEQDDDHAERTRRELRRQVQEGLREHAGWEAPRAAVLGAMLLQAENLWAETASAPPSTPDSDTHHYTGRHTSEQPPVVPR